jgi:peptide/nickel transport system ATP-binding protein
VPLLEVKNLSMHYWTRKGEVKAVDDVTFALEKSEAVGLVGESGCGKTSMALTFLKLLPENAKILKGNIYFFHEFKPQEAGALVGETVTLQPRGTNNRTNPSGRVTRIGQGQLWLQPESNSTTQVLKPLNFALSEIERVGVDLVPLGEERMQKVRWKGISMIFQAAMNSWDPVYRVGDQILEAMQTHTRGFHVQKAKERIAELFRMVGLDPRMMERYPHEYSGGMKQRAVIAMALSCDPDLIIADEPTTALDVIVQDKILRELRQIQKQLHMSMIYISHDIAVIAEVADKIGVMYAGKLVEYADTETIFKRPAHPYTKALMSSFPNLRGEKKKLEALPGEPPDLINPPKGCRFHPRCPYATDICKEQDPKLEVRQGIQVTACWNPLN